MDPQSHTVKTSRTDNRCGIFQRVKKVVIPSQCSHWRGNPPVIRNIFNSENADFPKIQGIATPVCGLVRDDR